MLIKRALASLMALSGVVWGGETSAVPFLNQVVTARESGMGDSELSHQMTLSYSFVPVPQKVSKIPVSQNQTRVGSDKKNPVRFAPRY